MDVSPHSPVPIALLITTDWESAAGRGRVGGLPQLDRAVGAGPEIPSSSATRMRSEF